MNYPKPSAMGGTLIRNVIQNFKEREFPLPLTQPILIACSGGVDSVALAHLICKYGRKVISPDLVTLLHFDHGWRKESATIERNAVKKLAKELGVGFVGKDLRNDLASSKNQSANAEEVARHQRNAIYHDLAGSEKSFRYVLTAHHQDDLVETLIWRFFRGELFEQKEGILFLDDPVLRPFLKASKEQLREYARQERLKFFEDPTNESPDQMRGRLRTKIIPLLEKSFPGLKRSVAAYADQERTLKKSSSNSGFTYALEQVLTQNGIASKLNRTQKLQIESLIKTVKIGDKISLPGGVQLEQQKGGSFHLKINRND